MRCVIYDWTHSTIAFLLRLCYIKSMANEETSNKQNQKESELSKFNLHYEFIIPSEDRETEAVARKHIPRSHRNSDR
jgi:hypothetical protein